MNFLIVQEQ